MEHLLCPPPSASSQTGASRPTGKLIGLTDGFSRFTAVVLVLLGGLAYSAFGVEALGLAATVFVALPAAWILVRSAAGAPDVRPLSVNEDLQR